MPHTSLFPPPARREQILHLALPIIGGMMSQNLLNLADAWMVGSLGEAALAATGIANFLNFMAVAFITGISPAVQAIAARRIGEGRGDEAAAPLNGGLMLSILIGLPLTLILVIAAPWMLAALNPDPAVVHEGTAYLQWRLVAIVAVGMNFSFRGYWSALKLAKYYMYTLVLMHVLNVIFSYSLIHGLFGLPRMGTAGAGLGTTLAIFVGTAAYVWIAQTRQPVQGLMTRLPTPEQFKSLLKLGLPSSVQQLLFSSGFVALFWIIGLVGTAELAVANVLVTITLTAILPAIGLGIAATTLVGQALGRKDADDAHRWVWDVFKVGLWIFVPLSLGMVLFADFDLRFFLREQHLVDLGRLPLQLVGATIALDGLGLIMMNALLGAGDSKRVMVVAVGLQWFLFLPIAYLLGPVFGFGLFAIWIALGTSRLIQTAVFTAAWEKRAWVHIKI
ncbi:MAG: MATE family efflux transporter [Pseudomonadota bacterium]|mgnify:CR=1 FL=1